MPCRGQLYQKHKYDRAFEIIEKSFTFGAKLKRNPISEHEREKNRDKIRIEKNRFALYHRAWLLRHRKSKSMATLLPGDKHVFRLDWGKEREGPGAEGSQGKKKGRKKQRLGKLLSMEDDGSNANQIGADLEQPEGAEEMPHKLRSTFNSHKP